MAIDFPDVLYHYCSTEAFFEILKSKRIWLSSLRQSSDFLEGKLIAHALNRFAEEDQLGEDYRRALRAFGAVERSFEGIALCLSEDGDLLSQWRGYAADATGVSVGFSASYLAKLGSEPVGLPSFELVKIDYAKDETRDDIVRPVYESVPKLLIDRGVYRRRLITMKCGWKPNFSMNSTN